MRFCVCPAVLFLTAWILTIRQRRSEPARLLGPGGFHILLACSPAAVLGWRWMKTNYITIISLIVLATTVLSITQGWIGYPDVDYIAAALFSIVAVIIIRQRRKKRQLPLGS